MSRYMKEQRLLTLIAGRLCSKRITRQEFGLAADVAALISRSRRKGETTSAKHATIRDPRIKSRPIASRGIFVRHLAWPSNRTLLARATIHSPCSRVPKRSERDFERSRNLGARCVRVYWVYRRAEFNLKKIHTCTPPNRYQFRLAYQCQCSFRSFACKISRSWSANIPPSRIAKWYIRLLWLPWNYKSRFLTIFTSYLFLRREEDIIINVSLLRLHEVFLKN